MISWDNTELRPSSVGMSALSAALGAVDASFFAIRCLSEAQRVLDHHNLLGGVCVVVALFRFGLSMHGWM